MTDKENAWKKWCNAERHTTSASEIFNAGWDAHAELVKPLIEAAENYRSCYKIPLAADADWSTVVDRRRNMFAALDALYTGHDAELSRQSDHFASCLAPLMDAVRQFLEAWDSRADVNDHVERIRKAMKESK